MKKILLSILALGAMTSASAQIHKKPAVIDYGDKVDYVEYQTWEALYADEGEDFSPSEYKEVTSRDADGRVLTLNKYNYDYENKQYSLTYTGYYTYNAAGQMLKEEQQYSNRAPRKEYTYDSDGKIVCYLSMSQTPKGKLQDSYREDYTYDDQGRMSTIDDYNYIYSGSVAVRNYHHILHYNDAGQLVMAESCKETDDNGNWVPYFSTEATYDANGNITLLKEYGQNKETGVMEYYYSVTYVYNEHGDMLSEKYEYTDGSASRTTTYSYTYDGKGRMTSYIETSPEGGKSQLKYSYEDTEASIQQVTDGAHHASKTIENGRVVIVRDNVKYNVLGQKM